MVSTVFHKRQFSILEIKEGQSFEILQNLKSRNELVLFPLMNKAHVKSLMDILSLEERKDIMSMIETDGEKKITLINFNKMKFRDVIRIEHVFADMFRFTTSNGTVITNSFTFTAYAV